VKKLICLILVSLPAVPLLAQAPAESLPDGTRRAYYPTGKLQSAVTYKNGRMDGSYQSFSEAGHPIELGTFRVNKWVGKYYMFNEDGSLLQNFTFNEQGRRSGLQRYYYSNGMLHMLSKLNNNVQEGYFLEFDSLGHLEEKPAYFIGGKRSDHENAEELQQMLEIARRENEALMGRLRTIFFLPSR
jgi:hypothetical protein